MNILFISDYSSSFKGGFIHSLLALSKKLKESGHNIYYIFSKFNNYLDELEQFGEVTIIESFREKKIDINLISKTAKLIKEKKIEIIHSNFGLSTFITGTLLSRFFGIKHISHERAVSKENSNKIIHLIQKIRARFIFKFLDLFGRNHYVAISKGVKENLINYNGFSQKNIEIIPNGVSVDITNFFKDEMQQIIDVVKTWSNKNFIQIAMTSQLEPRKDHFTIVEAANNIVNKQEQKNIRFIIIGDARNNKAKSYKEKLLNKIKKLNLEDYFYFTGSVPNPYLIIKHIDIGLQISKFEGFGNALVEYMLAGKPVIGTHVGGIPDIIDEGENGFLIDKGAQEQLTEYINKLIVNRKLREKLGNKAKYKAIHEYSNNQWAERIISLYKKQWKINSDGETHIHF